MGSNDHEPFFDTDSWDVFLEEVVDDAFAAWRQRNEEGEQGRDHL